MSTIQSTHKEKTMNNIQTAVKDADDLLWEAKTNNLFDQIISWLTTYTNIVTCNVITIPLGSFYFKRYKNILRVTFSSGKYTEFLPLGPYVMGNNGEGYFAKISLRINNRKYEIVNYNEKDDDWQIAEYIEYNRPLVFSPFNKTSLEMVLF